MIIRFTVPGNPIAQPRHQVSGRHRWIKGPKAGGPHPVLAFKEAVRIAANDQYRKQPPLEGPVSVNILFLLARPQSLVWKRKPMPRIPCGKTPDIDNFTKAVLDPLKRLLFNDDGQIFRIHAEKWYCAAGEQACTIVEVMGQDKPALF